MMFTAEFEAKIEDGKIAIPDEYKSIFEKQANIKVILVKPDESILAADEPIFDGEDLIQKLLNHPLAIADLVPANRDEFYDR